MKEIEIIEQAIEDVQPALKYFTESKLSKEEFKEIVYEAHDIQNHKLDPQIEKKINKVVEEGYQYYLAICELVANNGVRYLYTNCSNIEGKGPKNKTLEYLQEVGELKTVDGDSKLVSCIISLDNFGYSVQLYPPRKYFDIPEFSSPFSYEGADFSVIPVGVNTELTSAISGTESERAIDAIKKTKDINVYALLYGNNPILLSIAKGYGHTCPQEKGSYQQRYILDELLKREDLDINCIDLKYGMTPLHIACLRGDSLELIQKLLDKGANPEAINYQGKKPIDLLSWEYKEVQEFVKGMTGDCEFGDIRHDAHNDVSYEDKMNHYLGKVKLPKEKVYAENQSYTATLPTQEEREKNIETIREILSKNRSQKNTVEGQDVADDPLAPTNSNSSKP